MPWLLTISAFLFLIAGVAFVGSRAASDSDDKAIGAGIAVVASFIALIFLVFSCTTIVSTRNVGIVTSFGKPVGIRSNGINLKWPWQKIPELNGQIQTDSQTGGFDSSGKCSNGTPVRLANQSTACVDNTIRWRIQPNSGDELFRDYLDNDNIRDSLVTRELNATLNRVFATYNPLSPDAVNGPNLSDLSVQATKSLQQQIGQQIDVQNVIISIVHFDPQTQDKINAYQAQIANTHIAEESQKTAAAQAQANQILSGSVDNSINVLISRCLDIINSGKQVPTGFSCFPGSGMAVTIPGR